MTDQGVFSTINLSVSRTTHSIIKNILTKELRLNQKQRNVRRYAGGNIKFCFARNKINYDWVSLMQSYRKYVNKGSIVLEIGASNVERTRELSQFCNKLIGVELLP